MRNAAALKEYWRQVKAGERPAPERAIGPQPTVRKVRCQSNWVRGGDAIITIYPHGEIGFREPGRRTEYKLSTAEGFRQAALITIAKVHRRTKEIKKEKFITRTQALKLARKEVYGAA